MKILKNEVISKYTTIKIGGVAQTMLFPETINELLEVIKQNDPKYFIGGGSNLLISERVYDLVVNLSLFNQDIRNLGKGQFEVGASVRLQKLINTINEAGCGGIEYLFSVPGLVGGAIVMNAGRGEQYHQTISDYIVTVDVIKDGKIVTLEKSQCEFKHRDSIFKNGKDVIVSSVMQFPSMIADESSRLKKERLALCKEKQDASKPNFGSVFSENNARIMNFAKKHKIGKGKVHFSGKTRNWIINEGGSFDETMSAIKKVELLHKLLGKKITREVIIWD